jgi:hypothetical protein
MRNVLTASLVSLFFMASPAMADMIEIGSGQNSAELYLEFKDGAVYEFSISFDGSTTGLGLFDIVEAETGLTTIRQDYGYGTFIDGVTYDGHSNIGFGGGEDWWHYWVKNGPADEWTSPTYGVADRIIEDGYSDGWIYGRATAVPEPATMALLLIGGLACCRRKRNDA